MKKIVYTMAKNESRFLPVWARYYSKHFADLLVLDHNSDDRSIESVGSVVQVRRLDYPVFNDFQWYTKTIKETQAELLRDYDVVVFCEPDELLWHPSGLGSFCDSLDQDCIRAKGYNILQMPQEPKLDWEKPILSQRTHWSPEEIYDKTLISKVPLEWTWGFHGCHRDVPYGDDLILFHLHHVDRAYLKERALEKRKWNWSKQALELHTGTYILNDKIMKLRMLDRLQHATLMPAHVKDACDF